MFISPQRANTERLIPFGKIGNEEDATASFGTTQNLFSTQRKFSLIPRASSFTQLGSINIATNDAVLSNQDLLAGATIAFSLAFLFSFLQGRSPSSSNFNLWPRDRSQVDVLLSSENDQSVPTDIKLRRTKGEHDRCEVQEDQVVFDEWRDMSKPENYLIYNVKLRKEQQGKQDKANSLREENRTVFFALVLLFVPIFSIEFFFALSRQFICGNFLSEVDDSMWLMETDKAISAMNGLSPWAKELCSPHLQE